MPRAIWNGVTLAEAPAARCHIVEGNVYFPPNTITATLFRESATHTVCSWKGTASYYDVIVDGAVNRDAAWFYPAPKPAAAEITGYVAFWHGVQVEQETAAQPAEAR